MKLKVLSRIGISIDNKDMKNLAIKFSDDFFGYEGPYNFSLFNELEDKVKEAVKNAKKKNFDKTQMKELKKELLKQLEEAKKKTREYHNKIRKDAEEEAKNFSNTYFNDEK